MSIIHTRCPLCGSASLQLSLSVKDHYISKESFDLVRCNSCTFLFTQNIPPENEIASYYVSDDYISHSNTNKGLVNRLYHLVRDIMLRKKMKIIRSFAKGKNLLDIGSGTGHFLHFMKKNGYDTLGIEVSDEANKIAIEQFGLEIESPDKFLDGTIQKKYDVITMWHVLEHVHHLDHYMKNIYEALNDNGWAFIALPNHDSFEAEHYRSFWSAYDTPRHLWHFSPDTMNDLAKKNGFSIQSLRRLPFDSFYNAMNSENFRASKFPLVFGFLFGFISYCVSIFDIRRSSSIVYVMKKSTP